MSFWHIFSFSFPLKTLCSLALCVFLVAFYVERTAIKRFLRVPAISGCCEHSFCQFSTVVVISKFGFAGGGGGGGETKSREMI